MKPFLTAVFLFFIIPFTLSQTAVEITDQCEFDKEKLPLCRGFKPAEVVIRNVEELKDLPMRYDGSWFADVDFSKYSFLAKYVSFTGCDVSFEHQVFKDVKRKKVTYVIVVNTKGGCEILGMSWNQVLVPKIPDDYTVDFQVLP